MWCVAPEWPSHAQHLAVEFVHPVVVGKRALPALLVEGPDLVGSTRVLSSPGDVIVAVSSSTQPDVLSAMRRAATWGVSTVWIGCGERPDPGAADHVLWLDADVADAVYGGGFVLCYHLLWELTQVCLEHPGLVKAVQADETSGSGEVCITCSDEGRTVEVVSAVGPDRARVRAAGVVETVDTSLVGTPEPGDLLLVHAGSALEVLERAASGGPR